MLSRWTLAVVALFAVLGSGCQWLKSPADVFKPYPKTYYIVDANEPAAQVAASAWMAAIPELTLSVVNTCPGGTNACIVVYHSTMKDVTAICVSETTDLGCTWALPAAENGSAVFLATDASAGGYAWVFIHELGHAMGLLHTESGTVMNADYPTASHTITPADVRQWRGLRGETSP